MEQKYSEQAPMSIGWYEAEIKRLEAENKYMIDVAGDAIGTDPSLRSSACVKVLADHLNTLRAEVSRLTALVQQHQAYQTKQGEK
jgi:hypothetical protein